MELPTLPVELQAEPLEIAVPGRVVHARDDEILNGAGKDLEVVQPTQNLLKTLDHAYRPLGPPLARVTGELERVPQLLGGDTDPVHAVRGVERPGGRHRFAYPLRPTPQPCRQRTCPDVGLVPHTEHPRHLGQVALQPTGVDRAQTVEQSLTALVPLIPQVLVEPLRRVRVDDPALGELINEPQRNINLAHAAQGSPDPPKATPCPGRNPPRHLGRAQRQDLAKPTGRDTTLMQRLDLTVDRTRQLFPKQAYLSLEGAAQGV